MIESLVKRVTGVALNLEEARQRGVRKNMEVSDWQFTFEEAFEGKIFPKGWLRGGYGEQKKGKK